jgi:dATP pyrophosphohydrolase
MARAPLQVLVLPYRRLPVLQVGEVPRIEYAIFSRADYPCWQFIAGGAEDQESPLQAARREAFEEAGIDPNRHYMALESRCTVPVYFFGGSHLWGESLYVVPEYSFGVDASGAELRLSSEHAEFQWLSYSDAVARLTYDSNKTALWELNQKVLGKGPRD